MLAGIGVPDAVGSQRKTSRERAGKRPHESRRERGTVSRSSHRRRQWAYRRYKEAGVFTVTEQD